MKISTTQIEKMKQFYAEGHSLREIARRTGVARGTVRKYVDYAPSNPPRKSSLSIAQAKSAAVMRAGGATYREIALKMGCSLTQARHCTKNVQKGLFLRPEVRDFFRSGLATSRMLDTSETYKRMTEHWKKVIAEQKAKEKRKQLDRDCVVLLLIALAAVVCALALV